MKKRFIFTTTETRNQAMLSDYEKSLDLWYRWNDKFYFTPPCFQHQTEVNLILQE